MQLQRQQPAASEAHPSTSTEATPMSHSSAAAPTSHAVDIAATATAPPLAVGDAYPTSKSGATAPEASGRHRSRTACSSSPLLVLALLSVIALLLVLVALAAVSFHQLRDNATVTLSSQSASTQCVCPGADTVTATDLAKAIANLANAYAPNADAQLERESSTVLQDPAGYSAVFDFNQPHSTDVFTPYGYSKIANIENYPATHNQAISQTLFQLEPQGCNSPHHHPEAVEILFVFQGTINVTRVEPNGGATYSDTLHENMTVIFPRGHIHFQHNIGVGVARYISTLNSELPGVMSEAQRICNLPFDVLLSMWAGADGGVGVADVRQRRQRGAGAGHAHPLPNGDVPGAGAEHQHGVGRDL